MDNFPGDRVLVGIKCEGTGRMSMNHETRVELLYTYTVQAVE